MSIPLNFTLCSVVENFLMVFINQFIYKHNLTLFASFVIKLILYLHTRVVDGVAIIINQISYFDKGVAVCG